MQSALAFKELVVILIIALVFFRIAKPVALTFTAQADFERRRRAWFILTIIAFASPNIWWLFALAAPVLYVTGRKDSNPAAVYMQFMTVIPPIGQTVSIGGKPLLPLDTFMLLSLCLMVPAALSMLRTKGRPRYRELKWMDLALLGYGVLASFQYLQSEAPDKTLYPITFSDSIRRVMIFVVIAFVPYFVASRSNTERKPLLDSLASFCFSCGLMSAIALFETTRSWLLYADLPERIGSTMTIGVEYMIRNHSLRAMASAGHPLTMATLLSVGIVCWLYLRTHIASQRMRWAVTLLLLAGLFVTYSRSPWIGAAAGCIAFVALLPRAFSNMLKAGMAVVVLAIAVSLTPFGEKIMNLLPIFGGAVDVSTLTYRQRLLDEASKVIGQHPFIGDTTAMLQMEDLRQGEGIIDLVNVYIQILLNEGILGLVLFFSFALIAIAKANSIRRRLARTDADMSLLGTALIASLAGLFVTFAGGSLNNSERLYYMLGALVAGYIVTNRVKAAPRIVQPAEKARKKAAVLTPPPVLTRR